MYHISSGGSKVIFGCGVERGVNNTSPLCPLYKGTELQTNKNTMALPLSARKAHRSAASSSGASWLQLSLEAKMVPSLPPTHNVVSGGSAATQLAHAGNTTVRSNTPRHPRPQHPSTLERRDGATVSRRELSLLLPVNAFCFAFLRRIHGQNITRFQRILREPNDNPAVGSKAVQAFQAIMVINATWPP